MIVSLIDLTNFVVVVFSNISSPPMGLSWPVFRAESNGGIHIHQKCVFGVVTSTWNLQNRPPFRLLEKYHFYWSNILKTGHTHVTWPALLHEHIFGIHFYQEIFLGGGKGHLKSTKYPLFSCLRKCDFYWPDIVKSSHIHVTKPVFPLNPLVTSIEILWNTTGCP